MDLQLINNVSTIAFFVVIAVLGLITLMAAYVFIRYGRSKNLAAMISLGFSGLFFLAALNAFIKLQQLF